MRGTYQFWRSKTIYGRNTTITSATMTYEWPVIRTDLLLQYGLSTQLGRQPQMKNYPINGSNPSYRLLQCPSFILILQYCSQTNCRYSHLYNKNAIKTSILKIMNKEATPRPQLNRTTTQFTTKREPNQKINN